MSDYAAMAQSVERYLGKVEVTGSSPVSSLWKAPNIRGFFLLLLHIRAGTAPIDSGKVCVYL